MSYPLPTSPPLSLNLLSTHQIFYPLTRFPILSPDLTLSSHQISYPLTRPLLSPDLLSSRQIFYLLTRSPAFTISPILSPDLLSSDQISAPLTRYRLLSPDLSPLTRSLLSPDHSPLSRSPLLSPDLLSPSHPSSRQISHPLT